MGGTITVATQPGEGTTFRVTLPSAPTPPQVSERPEAPASTKRGKRRGRIAIVETDEIVAAAMRRALGTSYDVSVETDARVLLVRIGAGESFDLVFCALTMPGMSGIELHDCLLVEHAEMARRIVFLTEHAFEGDTTDLLRDNQNPRMEKPIDANVLRAMAKRWTGEG